MMSSRVHVNVHNNDELLLVDKTRVRLDYVTIQNRILKLNFKFFIWIKVSNFNLNQFVLVFKSAVKIWAKLNIRNHVKNYPVLQVRSWICGGQGSWFVLKSFSLGHVSLLWKFELNWRSGCWEKFLWWLVGGGGWHSRIESVSYTHLTLPTIYSV